MGEPDWFATMPSFQAYTNRCDLLVEKVAHARERAVNLRRGLWPEVFTRYVRLELAVACLVGLVALGYGGAEWQSIAIGVFVVVLVVAVTYPVTWKLHKAGVLDTSEITQLFAEADQAAATLADYRRHSADFILYDIERERLRDQRQRQVTAEADRKRALAEAARAAEEAREALHKRTLHMSVQYGRVFREFSFRLGVEEDIDDPDVIAARIASEWTTLPISKHPEIGLLRRFMSGDRRLALLKDLLPPVPD